MGNPGHVEPTAARRWLRYARPLVCLAFRPRLDGMNNLPAQGPFLLVANHSGLGLAEIMSIIVCLLERSGDRRPIAAMVHPLSFNAWPTGRWMRRLGAIPSTYAAAQAALERGVPVLVFPGGDHEAMRPIWQAHQVRFAGRKGFLKIARGARIPVVPLGIRGSHFTAPVLWRSDRWLARVLLFPRLLGIKRMPVTLAGVLGAIGLCATGPIISWWLTAVLALLWLALPVSHLPWIPWSIRMMIGMPIPAGELFADDSDHELDRAYDRVVAEIQRLITPRRPRRR